MARRVKLQDTGEYSTSDVAYRAPNKKYYSSKEAFVNREKAKNYRQQCIEKLQNIMGYQPGMKLPTLAYKKINEYERPYGFDVLLETMNSQESSMLWAIKNKNFTSETGKVMYLFAIIQNNAMDAFQKKVHLEKVKREQQKKQNAVEMVELKPVEVEHKKDVSDLLGGESWI